jgi:2-iminobutanoate/2-iminopropanoate deaminase
MKFNLGVAARFTFLALVLGLGVVGCASGPPKEAVSTKEAPDAIGPYSQGVKVGNLLFLAGQAAIDPKTNQMISGSIEEQSWLGKMRLALK